jgi:hypothetical protein
VSKIEPSQTGKRNNANFTEIRHRDWTLYLPPKCGGGDAKHVRRKYESKVNSPVAGFWTSGWKWKDNERKTRLFHVFTKRARSVSSYIDVMSGLLAGRGWGLIQGLKRFDEAGLSVECICANTVGSAAVACARCCMVARERGGWTTREVGERCQGHADVPERFTSVACRRPTRRRRNKSKQIDLKTNNNWS